MARVTVEDCLENVDNRFELIMVSSKRARQLATGGKDAMVEWGNDKPTVVALREIADGFINASILNEEEQIKQEFEEISIDPEMITDTTQVVAEETDKIDESAAAAASPDVDLESEEPTL